MAKQGVRQKWQGLSAQEVGALLKQYGTNEVIQKKRTGPVMIFLSKLKNPLMVLMIVIALVSFFLGEKISSAILLGMVFLSSILDFLNSYKSQNAVEALAARVATKVTVYREGERQDIDFKYVVPGDIVTLAPGCIVPADCEIAEADDFFVNQSALTGESLPVEKVARGQIDERTIKTATKDLYVAYMGTSVVSGNATAVVMATGADTEYGKIAKELNKAEPKTDFEISITKFSLFIMKLVFYMVSFVFIVYLVKNSDNLSRSVILQAVTFAVAITIGVTPDMLPAIMTLCLSHGSQRMARKQVIVKHLSSIENFGSMDILCTDKTGTLTKDHIALVKYVNSRGDEDKWVLELGHLTSHFHAGMQNPLDDAINEFKDIDVSMYEKIDEIPYDFSRKRSSMVVVKNKKRMLITKGAPEEMIKICSKVVDGAGSYEMETARKAIEKQFSKLSQDGFRVLAIAHKELPNRANVTNYEPVVETDMIFDGFLAFLDPPKDDVKTTIADLNRLGIEVKILTGDNHLLAEKICREVGVQVTNTLTGDDLRKMNDVDLARQVLTTTIFARITPDQKERIIMTLKKLGKSVGYMGDGINDAPALRVADVGISVNNAVDIAKETAAIILMEKSLEALKDGVIEGRKTFHNTTKYVLMGLSSNFGNMFSMMGAAAFLPFLPMLPTQILFNNFIYDVSQMSLPTDEVDKEDLLRPTHWDLKFIKRYMVIFGLISSLFDFLTFGLLYFVYQLSEHAFQTGWLIESFATQVFVIYIIRTKKIPFLQSRPSRQLFVTTLVSVLFVWSVQFTPLAGWLNLEPLPLHIMAIIVCFVAIYLVLVQIVKVFFYRHYHNNQATAIVSKPAQTVY